MLDLLNDYISDSLPQWGDFATNPNLTKKVGPTGELLPYRGNTVVFLLDDDTKQKLRQLQENLYQAVPEMLAQPLREDTFHMTLHDLVNGHPGRCGLQGEMRAVEERAAELLAQWTEFPSLPMKATWLFNMVNTSIVLGLAPADDDAGQQLEEMYTALEEVVRLGYALTPHITMAYFRPGVYKQEQVQRLREALSPVNLNVTLTADNLVLQTFEDMNHYQTVELDAIQFLQAEQVLLNSMECTAEACRTYLARYEGLPPKAKALAGSLIAERYRDLVDPYDEDEILQYPFSGIAQSAVNNGIGQMVAIRADAFAVSREKRLFYVRSDMWISPQRKGWPIPQWIENLARDVETFSSGLADVQVQAIPFAFDDGPADDYYAITFRLDSSAVKRKIELAGELFYMAETGDYILTLTDIMGEYEACYGELCRGMPVVLDREFIDFK